MTSAIPPSCVPQLPAEMWRMVLGNFGTTDEDLIHLWLTCRHVSRLLKLEVEYIFATKHVPKTSLWVGNGASLQTDRSRVIDPYLTPPQQQPYTVTAQRWMKPESLGKVLEMMPFSSFSGSSRMANELSSAILRRLA